MSSNYYYERMSNPLAIALRQSPTPDQMYRHAFGYFQAVCAIHPDANMRGINILAHDLPEALRANRALLGATMSGAIAAILDHETQCGILGDVPTNLHAPLDDIIIEQGEIVGATLLTSDLALGRVAEWERSDSRKYERWLKALGKAARVHQRRQAAPITDPILKDVKRAAVPQIRLVMNRMKERFGNERRTPTDAQIVEAFIRELDSPDVPWMAHEHNRRFWLDFFRRDPLTNLHLSAERLYDAYDAFVRGSNSPNRAGRKFRY